MNSHNISEHQPLLPPHISSNNTRSYNNLSVLYIFLFPAIGGVLFGYDIGATSGCLTQMTSSQYSNIVWYNTVAHNYILKGLITSTVVLGAMIGSMVCFYIADIYGRKKILIFASILYFLGSFMEYMCGSEDMIPTLSITLLFIGRLVYGAGCGFSMHSAPAYIGEMSPPSIRGALVSMKESFIVLGMLLGYSLAYSYRHTPGGWRLVYGIAMPISVVMCVGIAFLPPSARWLALQGRFSEAKCSMEFVSRVVDEVELRDLREVASAASEPRLGGSWQALTRPSVCGALQAGLGVIILQQITGQPSVLYYASTLCADVGLDTGAAIYIAVFKFIATSASTLCVDRFGRKKLLYIGCGMMLSALVILSISFTHPYMGEKECNEMISESDCPDLCYWAPGCKCHDDTTPCSCCGVGGLNLLKSTILGALFLYIGGYQVGFGPIAWLLISELFPLDVRGRAVSAAVVTNFFFNAVVTFSFAVELDTIGESATFLIYAIILAVGWYFIIIKRVPETKGLTLEQIEEFFIVNSRPSISL
mmetsp:Transcript_23812/g.34914  ORF Transcript_23812/g.34914 Transcript_23812/m.34914 type:complete len:534 (-) Transcript_23812:29-1630(-)